jgi:hypothetical protein
MSLKNGVGYILFVGPFNVLGGFGLEKGEV